MHLSEIQKGRTTMKTVIWGFLIGVLLPVSHTDQGLNDFVEIFRDDFNGSGTPDPAKWKLEQTAAGADIRNERQVFRRENFALENGLLHLFTRNEQYNGYNYTSGRVSTRGLFDFQYGELELRAKITADIQHIGGTVTLQNSQCDTTIPCREFPGKATVFIGGGEALASIADHVPRARPPPEMSTLYFKTLPSNFTQDFHVFKVTWTPDQLVWFIDDVAVWSITGEAVPRVRMQVVLNSYAGQFMPSVAPPDVKLPFGFTIDYVVVRQSTNSTGSA
ncbi:clotting factor G alpha subunit-like [Paramacrobiotus metropolitanus]|uniref:clotting factor G alpha subunit-like n=1 Tax=Paramacrobiotus metropolitanus TaxID=2943436 RepID=UPI002445D96A|nr:clotting factor G alpha subunit-like [Paramacrobiotus metropolitanus]